MIKSIELVNWKTHEHTVMNFQKGVNVLIGVMGAGKSSIIDGISFGLFGTFPKLNHKRTTIDELISNRPKIMDDAEVKITFNIGDDEYKVTRKINRKESTASKIEKNGAYIQTQTARVNEEIESLIKINYNTFSRAIYAEQNRLDYFLELTKSERKKQIDEMLGLDSFAVAEENATSLINSIKSLIGDEEQTLTQIDGMEVKAQLEKLTKEKSDMNKEQASLTEQIKIRDATVKKLGKELEDIKTKYEKSKKLAKEIAELTSKIETLNRELKGIESQGIDRAKIESEQQAMKKRSSVYDIELKSLRKDETVVLKELAEADAAIKECHRKILERDMLLESIKDKVLGAMEKDAEGKNASLQISVKELSSLKGRREEAKKWADELIGHIGKCPVCERELDEAMKKTLLDQKSRLINEIDGSITQTQKKIEELEKEMAYSRKELERIRLATSKLEQYKGVEELMAKSAEISKDRKGKHATIAKSMEKCNSEIEAVNKQISLLSVKLDAANRKVKYELDIKNSSSILEKDQSEMKEINFDEKSLYSLQELITKESSMLSDISSKLTGNEKYIKSIDAQIEDRTKSLATINLIAARIETRRSQISSMNKFRSALIETETQLRNSLVTSINSLMLSIWSEIYPYGDYTGIRLNAKKDDYALEACTGLDGNGTKLWIEMDGIASGGERSIACLTMRIALAMVIVPNLKWLILDEPTHNIDDNGIGKFINVLGNSLPSVVEQIFIITHDGNLKNISSARVYQLDRDKDKNEYTSVIEV